jgi:DNA repair exonuclease SbcCD nuclease subunit
LDRSFGIADPGKSSARKDDLNRNFSRVVEFALKEKPELFLVSGDIFDRVHPSNLTRVFLTESIRKLVEAEIQVFMVAGNHDVPKMAPLSPTAIDVLGSAGLATVFSSSEHILHRVFECDQMRVCVSGKSYDATREYGNPLAAAQVPLLGDINILILHGSLRGLGVTTSIPEMADQNPFHPDDIAQGLTYLALGHFHNYFERNHNGTKIANPGSIEKMTWAEIQEEKGFIWADLNRDAATTKFIPLETRPMVKHEINLTKEMEDSSAFLLSELRRLADPEKLVRVQLKGVLSPDQYSRLRMNEIYRAAHDMFFHLSIDRSELEVEGFGRLFVERIESPREAFAKRLDKLITKTQSADEVAFLSRVKELGEKYLSE